MPYQIATAANMEDMFTRVVNFATTNADLVTAGQNWEVLRMRRDNLEELTTDLAQPDGLNGARRSINTCRYDARSTQVDAENQGSPRYGAFVALAVVPGSSYVRMKLREAREVTRVRLRAAANAADSARMINNFRLQWSDNDSTWTTCLTVNSSPSYAVSETKDFNVPSLPGAHLYWRIIIDTTQGISTVGWAAMLLLQADGTVANHFGSEVILKGPGLAGEDEIYVGIRTEYSQSGDWYNFFLNGYTGFDPNEQSWLKQPGALPDLFASPSNERSVPMVPMWNSVMPYWLSVSGRSIRLGVKVSTSYEGMYLGFILPYCMPSQYPYPLVVGGSLVSGRASRGQEWRYSFVNWRHSNFHAPGADAVTSGGTDPYSTTMYLRYPDGSWQPFAQRPEIPSFMQPDQVRGIAINSGAEPPATTGSWRCVWPHSMNDQWSFGKRPYRECLGGGYLGQPCILHSRSPINMVFGQMEGIYSISGYGSAAENTTTLNGKEVVILQNAYRTAVHEYWGISLE